MPLRQSTFPVLSWAGLGLIAWLAVAPLMAAVPSDTDPAAPRVNGSLSYLARIALPPTSVAAVEVWSTSGPGPRLVADWQLALAGRQVPIAFELRVPRAGLIDAVLVGALHVGDGRIWRTAPVALPDAADSIDLGTLLVEMDRTQAFAQRWRCAGRIIVSQSGDDGLLLNDGTRGWRLRATQAAGGARYVGSGDDAIEFRIESGTATLRAGAGESITCQRLDAPAPLRATGNEPGWVLTTDAHALTLSFMDGTRIAAAPPPLALSTVPVLHYRLRHRDQDVEIRVSEQRCEDSMTGMPHPLRVAIQLGTRQLHGCGGDPASLLRGAEWLVETIDGVSLVSGSRATLNFHADGTLGGQASCNNFRGGYRLTGEGLRIERPALTMMACEDALNAQEQRLMSLLPEIYRFEIEADGALRLHCADGRYLRARRAPATVRP